MTIETVLDALEAKGCAPKQRGNEWISKCPAHEDETPSFGVSIGADARVLVKCQAGCTFEAIAAALSVAKTDFFAAKAAAPKATKPRPKVQSQQDWAITDALGRTLAVHRRFNYEGGKKKVIWFLPDGVTPSKKGEPGAIVTEELPLYGLPRLPADPAVPVFVTEGEKDADALLTRGVAALGTVTGAAGTPCDQSLAALKGRAVILWPDADAVGRAHMVRVGARLVALGAGSVRTVLWADDDPNGPPAVGDGAHDYFARSAPSLDRLLAQALDFLPPPAPTPAAPRQSRRILVAGAHWTQDGYVERGAHVFVDDVLRAFPPDALCRFGGLVGRLQGPTGRVAFSVLTGDAMRLLADSHVALERTIETKDGGHELQFVPATRDQGGLLLTAAQSHPAARELSQVVRHPVYLADWTLAKSGWNSGGIYYDEPENLRGLVPHPNPAVAFEVIADALVDFPFKDEASRFNAVGFMLSPLLRPAVGNVPLHIVHAAQERTGKTKLVELMAAVAANLDTVPAMRFDGSDEERDKRILAALLTSPSILHLDNISQDIDSGSLAMLLTASTYSGRLLGTSTILTPANHVCLIGTGNNVALSAEMSKRTVPILLQATSAAPEARADFVHPDLPAFIAEARRPCLEALLGLVEHWKRQGRPGTPHRLGGFEGWVAAVGGILAGSPWFTNATAWQRTANPRGADLDAFVEVWSRHPDAAGLWRASDLCKLAREAGLFAECFTKGDASGSVSFSRRVLSASTDRYVGLFIIRRLGSGNSSFYRLERV